MENEQALSHCEKVGELDLAIVVTCTVNLVQFPIQNTPIQIYIEFLTSETVAIPLRESGVGNYVLEMCTTVNLDKVFNVSSDQPVFFLRFCTKRAHNRKCRQNL